VNEPRSAWLAIVGRFETGFSRLGHYPRQRLDDCEVRQEFWRNVVPPYLIVSAIEAARTELVVRGAAVSEVFHATTPGAQFYGQNMSGRVNGPAPDHATSSPRSAIRTATAGCSGDQARDAARG
jgi:hypothetical protein